MTTEASTSSGRHAVDGADTADIDPGVRDDATPPPEPAAAANGAPSLVARARSALSSFAHRTKHGYQGDHEELVRHAGVLAGYGGIVATVVTAATLAGKRLPDRFGLGDTVLLAVATHKASRLVSKESVTNPLRAPFTRFEEPTGMAEVNESARGSGVQRAAGELVTCPFCVGVWVASALTAGLVLAPRPTRLVATTLSVVFGSDVLHLGYDAAKRACQ